MIIGIGTDIVENERFSAQKEGLLERLFTAYEIEESKKRVNKAEYFASRYAAKEAASKALGSGFRSLSPLDIEIREDDLGKPYLAVKGKESLSFHLSISHEREYSVAMVVIDG